MATKEKPKLEEGFSYLLNAIFLHMNKQLALFIMLNYTFF